MIRNFKELFNEAKKIGKVNIAIASAEDAETMTAALIATKENLANVIMVGDPEKIKKAFAASGGEATEKMPFEIVAAMSEEESAAKSVALVREGRASVIMKGKLKTSTFVKAVLNRETGIRGEGKNDRLLSDVLVYEDPLSGGNKLIGLTDGGICVLPNFEQKKQIIENAVEVFHSLGVTRPKVALLSAIEVPTESMPSSIDAGELSKIEFQGAEVYGPLAFDNAVSKEAAEAKGVKSDVAGNPDVLVMPNIEAGNIFAKSMIMYSKIRVGHVIVGAKVPIIIHSRVDTYETKLNGLLLGMIVGAKNGMKK